MRPLMDTTSTGPDVTYLSPRTDSDPRAAAARRGMAWPAVESAGVDLTGVPRQGLDRVAGDRRAALLAGGRDWLEVLAALGLVDEPEPEPGLCKRAGCGRPLPLSLTTGSRATLPLWNQRGYCSNVCERPPIGPVEDAPAGFVWRYMGGGTIRHLVPAAPNPMKSPCGRNPAKPWRGGPDDDRLASLRPCASCLRIVAGHAFTPGQTAD